ncbi:tetraspanin-3 [Bacillus rossius redtenbacheri]|uniref:tetraspanin-3 n=1 Tax=Bacillus rossius redtenbacheri TaxID=93214 RepID=UPI002FDEA165
MASVMPLNISMEGRCNLMWAMAVACGTQTLIWLALTLLALYAIDYAATYLHEDDWPHVWRLISSQASLCLGLAVLYLPGCVLAVECTSATCCPQFGRVLSIWLLATTVAMFCAQVTFWIMSGSEDNLRAQFHRSMLRGLALYTTDLSWKANLDLAQYSLACCGVDGLHDWNGSDWLHEGTFNVNKSIEMESYQIPGIVPWSCCKQEYGSACLHDILQLSDWAHLWKDKPEQVEESLHSAGCVDIIIHPIAVALFLPWWWCLAPLSLCLHISMTVMAQYLYTSTANSVLLGDPISTAPGWLLHHRKGAVSKQ